MVPAVDKIGGLANLFKKAISIRTADNKNINSNITSIKSFVKFRIGEMDVSLSDAKKLIEFLLIHDELNAASFFDGSNVTLINYQAEMATERDERIKSIVNGMKGGLDTGFGNNTKFNIEVPEIFQMLGKYCRSRQCKFETLEITANRLLKISAELSGPKITFFPKDILPWTDMFDENTNSNAAGAWLALKTEADSHFGDFATMLLIESGAGKEMVVNDQTQQALTKKKEIFDRLQTSFKSIVISDKGFVKNMLNSIMTTDTNNFNDSFKPDIMKDLVNKFFENSTFRKSEEVKTLLKDVVEKTLANYHAPKTPIPFEDSVRKLYMDPLTSLSCELDLLLATDAVISRTDEERNILKTCFSRLSYFCLPTLLGQPHMFWKEGSILPAATARTAFLYASSKGIGVSIGRLDKDGSLKAAEYHTKVSKLLCITANCITDNTPQQNNTGIFYQLRDRQPMYVEIELMNYKSLVCDVANSVSVNEHGKKPRDRYYAINLLFSATAAVTTVPPLQTPQQLRSPAY